MIQDIPKLYTALAEWLACVLFVRLLPQRYNAAKTAGILAAALIRLGAVVDRHCSAKPLDSRHDRGFGFDVRYNLVVLPLELL